MSSSVPPEPDSPARHAAARLFGDRLSLADAYAALLAGPGVVRGLIGPHEAERLWERHLLNSAAPAELIPENAEVLDLGSGAGLPGIPLALARPDLRFVLVEPMLRRTTFLDEAVAALGLGERVSVLRARGTELTRPLADVVVARAVAPLHRLAAEAVPLLRPGGLLLAWKGAGAADEVAAAAETVRRLTGGSARVHSVGYGAEQPVTVVEIRAGAGKGRR